MSPRCTSRAAAPLTLISPSRARRRSCRSRSGRRCRCRHVNLFVLQDVRRLEQVGINRDRPHVVQVTVRDRGPVDLRLQHHALHQASPFLGLERTPGAARRELALSISLVSPMRAATAAVPRGRARERPERGGVDEREVLGLDARPPSMACAVPTARRRRAGPPDARCGRPERACRARARGARRGSRRCGWTWRGRRARARSDTSRAGRAGRGRRRGGDDSRLLGVLLAEVGDVGHDHAEELRHHRGHAAEVGGAADGTLQSFAEAEHLDGGGEAGGIDLRDRGEDDVRAGLPPEHESRAYRAGTREVGRSSNCVGLTKTDTTTVSHCSRAARISER